MVKRRMTFEAPIRDQAIDSIVEYADCGIRNFGDQNAVLEQLHRNLAGALLDTAGIDAAKRALGKFYEAAPKIENPSTKAVLTVEEAVANDFRRLAEAAKPFREKSL